MRPAARSVLLGALLVASCAVGPAGGPPLPITTASLTDDYEMAHGLAEAAVFSGSADRDQIIRIITLDRAALDARNATVSNPSDPVRQQAQDAIAALADYATIVGAMAPNGVPSHISRSGTP